MSKVKEIWTRIKREAWECWKQAFTPSITYLTASTVLLLIVSKMGEKIEVNRVMVWAVVCSLAAVIYNALFCFKTGGTHYEMLVAGNLKRRSCMERGVDLSISQYKVEKEYRPWKGFVFGGIISVSVLLGGIVLGANGEGMTPDGSFSKGVTLIVFFLNLFAGWAMLPLQAYNKAGQTLSGYFVCIYAIIPIVVSGVFYIVGAYSRRNRRLREVEITRARESLEQKKEKKINYGGLPGTKPKKKR